MAGYRSYQDDGATGILRYHFPARGTIARVSLCLVDSIRDPGNERWRAKKGKKKKKKKKKTELGMYIFSSIPCDSLSA